MNIRRSITAFKIYLETKYGKRKAGILKGLIIAPLVILLGAIAFYVLSGIFSMPTANASEAQAMDKPSAERLDLSVPKQKLKYPFPEPPFAFIAVDYEFGDTFCAQTSGDPLDNRLVGNLGFGQTIAKNKVLKAQIIYHHHSCALGVDRNSYDALGFKLVYSPWQ